MWWTILLTLLAIYLVVACVLGYSVSGMLDSGDKEGIKKVYLCIVLWPLVLIFLIYLIIKANVLGNYEKG